MNRLASIVFSFVTLGCIITTALIAILNLVYDWFAIQMSFAAAVAVYGTVYFSRDIVHGVCCCVTPMIVILGFGFTSELYLMRLEADGIFIMSIIFVACGGAFIIATTWSVLWKLDKIILFWMSCEGFVELIMLVAHIAAVGSNLLILFVDFGVGDEWIPLIVLCTQLIPVILHFCIQRYYRYKAYTNEYRQLDNSCNHMEMDTINNL